MVTSIVLAIGLSILDLSIKELELSTLSKGSEEAFHAANAGVECARYWRNTADQDSNGRNDFVEGRSVTIDCFDGGSTSASPGSVDVDDAAGVAEAYHYTFFQDWPTGLKRCSVIDMVVVVSGNGIDPATGFPRDDAATVDSSDLPDSYPESDGLTCPSGGRCTLAFVQGFNSSCPATDDISKFQPGTIQREVLLRF